MYIIAIGWIYVTLLMPLTEENPLAGILTFTFYGLAPLALLLWLFGTPLRRRKRLRAEALDQVVGPDDGKDAQQDKHDLRDGGL